MADPALVPLYFVAKKAREHVTVVLSGEGADEFFGGYTIYREPLSLAALTSCPTRHAQGAAGGVQGLPEGVRARTSCGAAPPRSRSATTATPGSSGTTSWASCGAATPTSRYTTSPRDSTPTRAAGFDDVTTMQYVDLYTWLRGDILVKADRMSMAHSLELRVPFLDREVFEVAAHAPGRPAGRPGDDQVRAAPGAGAVVPPHV